MTVLYETSSAAMLANFPKLVNKIAGESTLGKHVCVLDTHLVVYAQSHISTVALNLLYIFIPSEIYQQYTTNIYPGEPLDSRVWDGRNQDTAPGRTQAKALWNKMHRHFTYAENMNRALLTRFMSHLDENMIQSCQHENQRKPNRLFCDTLQWFQTRFGISNEIGRQDNKNRMEPC